MLVTEEEAREKWCSEARVPGSISWQKPGGGEKRMAAGAQNRGMTMGQPIDGCYCLASGCMHWRWAVLYRALSGDIEVRICSTKGAAELFMAGLVARKEAEASDVSLMGYCGLSGRPE